MSQYTDALKNILGKRGGRRREQVIALATKTRRDPIRVWEDLQAMEKTSRAEAWEKWLAKNPSAARFSTEM